MTRMLASVRDIAEADLALRLGSDILDLKDVTRGVMTAVDVAIAEAIVAKLAGGRETSAALGDPPYEPSALMEKARAFAAAKVDDLEAAVDASTIGQCAAALATIARMANLIAVLFADEAPDFDLLPKLRALGFKGAMLDTKRKGAGRLIDHLDIPSLERFCSLCRAEGLTSGLAGSLKAPDVPRLLLVRPDVLGFRGALCRHHDRASGLDRQRFSLIRDLVPREQPELPAREFAGALDHENEGDRVFVRDFVVSASVGAYEHERNAPQRVVFDVVAVVHPAVSHDDDMRAIFSYDIILD